MPQQRPYSTIEKEEYANPAHILLLVRNGANDWATLCKDFGLNAERHDTATVTLRRNLLALRDAGLVEFEKFKWERPAPPIGPINVSEHWLKIQATLQISLKDLAAFTQRSSIVVTPYFGPPDDSSERIDLFVVMPFRQELQPVYEDHLLGVARTLKLTAKRADDFFGPHPVIGDIWNAIALSQVMIADCTDKNANVFYEIGVAHAIGKPVVLITQTADDVPFDLRHLRYILYSLTPRGMKLFEDTLRKTLIDELELSESSS